MWRGNKFALIQFRGSSPDFAPCNRVTDMYQPSLNVLLFGSQELSESNNRQTIIDRYFLPFKTSCLNQNILK